MTLWNKCIKMAYQLDKENSGWHRLINLEKLDMNNCLVCIIGQAFPQLNLNGVSPPEFITELWEMQAVGWSPYESEFRSEEYFEKLNKYWTTLVKQRQEKSKMNQYAHY